MLKTLYRQPWLGSPVLVLCGMETQWENKKGRRKKVDSFIVGRKKKNQKRKKERKKERKRKKAQGGRSHGIEGG